MASASGGQLAAASTPPRLGIAPPCRLRQQPSSKRSRACCPKLRASASAASAGSLPEPMAAGASLPRRLGAALSSPQDREIALVALPALVGLMMEPLVNAFNAGLVGHLGTHQLSAVSLGSIALNSVTFLFSFLLFLTVPEIAAAAAKKDDEQRALVLHMGVPGAAAASTAASFASCSVLLAMLVARGRVRVSHLLQPPSPGAVLPILQRGMVLGMRNMVSFGMILFASTLSARMGSAFQASFEVIRQLWMLTMPFFECLNVAAQSLCATSLGKEVMMALPLVCAFFPIDAAGAILDGSLLAAKQSNFMSAVQIGGSVVQYGALAYVAGTGNVTVLGVWVTIKLMSVTRLVGGLWRNFASDKSAYLVTPAAPAPLTAAAPGSSSPAAPAAAAAVASQVASATTNGAVHALAAPASPSHGAASEGHAVVAAAVAASAVPALGAVAELAAAAVAAPVPEAAVRA
ncbi:hypothetical protein TSOC_005062 [Tetrabaena socialis]|uniref:Protein DETOXIFICATION n=1 Tax=Tetrabaena socialis TaxID=47790 RepID=A0A2J8A736_9CHLO|nr:hypothetical protein TSOC_005062 [Tetrabaena socialis]|eukprot:PNH08342.1 hypothetical protein TSOC_005062 [Tetrabaena socialis]